MTGFKILQWSGSFDGPWSDEASSRYREGGYDGLSVYAGMGWNGGDIGFLDGLVGLRYLSLNTRIKSDLRTFLTPSLEELVLNTGCRLVPPDVSQESVRKAVVQDRPGLDAGRRWPEIESLRIGAWKGNSLEFLRGARKLSTIYLEGKRQSGDLAGLEPCSFLRELRSVNYAINDTAPLRGLQNLTSVDLMAARPTGPHGRVDLADFSGSNLRRLWISNAPQIFHVESLLEIPTIREIRLIDCGLDEGQRRTLVSTSLGAALLR